MLTRGVRRAAELAARASCNRVVTGIAIRAGLLLAAVLTATASAATDPGNAATPAACAAAESRAVLRSFVGAFNRGDLARLDELFATQPDFQWYSTGAPGLRTRAAASTRATLVGYFARRYRAGDRLRLVSFDYNGDSGPYSNFALTLRRSASDYRGGAWFRLVGKGAISCRKQPGKLIVVSLGGPDSAVG